MASDMQAILTEEQRGEIVAAIRPLVDKYADRYLVPAATVLGVVEAASPARRVSALPAGFLPAHPVMARLVAIAAASTGLDPAAVIEDDTPRANEARDAVVLVARRGADLSYETIGLALGGLDHDAVLDAYCRAIGKLEQADKHFSGVERALRNAVAGR